MRGVTTKNVLNLFGFVMGVVTGLINTVQNMARKITSKCKLEKDVYGGGEAYLPDFDMK